jgi:hypothetical protein
MNSKIFPNQSLISSFNDMKSAFSYDHTFLVTFFLFIQNPPKTAPVLPKDITRDPSITISEFETLLSK